MTAAWQNVEIKDKDNDNEEKPRGIVLLLKYLDIENDGETVGSLVVKELYKAGLLQLPAMDFSSLSSETALLWRVMSELWKEQKVTLPSLNFTFTLLMCFQDPSLENLPELSQICRSILQYHALSNQFVVKQLLALSKNADMADEVGRRNLNALICMLLAPSLKRV